MFQSNVFSAQKMSVLEVVSRYGAGTRDDPVRYVTEYFAEDGTLLAQTDRLAEDDGERNGETAGRSCPPPFHQKL